MYGDVTTEMRIAREEIFGPILSIFRWRDDEEVINMANATEYGLTAGVWTNDLRWAVDFTRQLEAGVVYVNATARHFVGTGFGGWKNSGLGREECLEELLSYTREKSVHLFG